METQRIGITPARAGKTTTLQSCSRVLQDHPRSCGKDRLRSYNPVPAPGSPPLVRERPHLAFLQILFPGITPARAGKTDCQFYNTAIAWDHPRSCGKDCIAVEKSDGELGSPPLVRERPALERLAPFFPGITPARAGKTVMDPLILANFFLPVFKIYLTSLQDI